ncbi:MAG: polysaccharide deacetylase family protein [Spirochaetales bacterium]|nr:polysaccharide deacetylase family protein [Spirochaetales bacterium]
MKRLSIIILVLLLAGGLCNIYGQVTFEGLDLNNSGVLLFSAATDSPALGRYSVLFSSWLGDSSISQLTYFPESIIVLGDSERIQIQNRFGVFRTGPDFQSMLRVEAFPSFTSGDDIGVGKNPSMAASADGRYLLFLRQVSPGYASLILLDLAAETELVVSEGIEIGFNSDGISWAPNSRFFVYSKGEEVFYFSIRQLLEDRVLPEEFRSLGKGGLENIFWSEDSSLYYIQENLVYKILSAEFFTRSLYQNLLGRGTIAGKLPFSFDSNFDHFWVSPDGGKILLDKGGQNLFLYYLKSSNFLSTGEIVSLPYLYLPRNTSVESVLWSSSDLITLYTHSIVAGDTVSRLYRLNLATYQEYPGFTTLDDEGITGISLSPDGSMAAILMEDRIVLRDYTSWEEKQSHKHNAPLFAIWLDDKRLVLSGRNYTEIYSINDDESKMVVLSQVDDYGFDDETGVVSVVTAGEAYSYTAEGDWKPVESANISRKGVSSPEYRVYLDSCSDRSYTNQVMVRMVEALGTVPLFDLPETIYQSFPDKEDPPDPYYFSHGSRLRRRELSLVFNGIDDSDGLAEVLRSLSDFGIKSTFFLNGEFIRENPEAAKEIAESGHEVGSLFHTYFNMTDSRYVVDTDFIKRGLARNEDDFFEATGYELSLLWHAPYYVVNTDILTASKEMNYNYVGRDVDPLDWALADASTGRSASLSAPAMVERIISLKKPGSIIPIRLGINDGRSGGYLYNNLDVLLNALLKEGYTVVPVSTLIERAK